MKLTLHAGDGDKKPITRESTKQPLKPFAQEKPECFGTPVVTNSCAFLLCTRGCGCAKHPAFPAPSVFEGHDSGIARAKRVARRRTCVCSSLSFRDGPKRQN